MTNFDSQTIDKAFNEAVIKTFADMAFVDVISESSYESHINYTSIMGLDFTSPGQGHIFFYMTKECKRSLVENIYGEDWAGLNDLEIDDCLLEILNVLAGEFLKNLFGQNQKIIMSFPKLYFDDDDVPHLPGEHQFIFNAEGAMFRSAVSVKE